MVGGDDVGHDGQPDRSSKGAKRRHPFVSMSRGPTQGEIKKKKTQFSKRASLLNFISTIMFVLYISKPWRECISWLKPAVDTLLC